MHGDPPTSDPGFGRPGPDLIPGRAAAKRVPVVRSGRESESLCEELDGRLVSLLVRGQGSTPVVYDLPLSSWAM